MIDWLLNPAVPLSTVLALIYTLAVHLFLGLGYRHLPRHWLLAIAGMAIGYAFAVRANSRLPTLGDMHIIESSVAAMVLLLLAAFKAKLSAPLPPPTSSR